MQNKTNLKTLYTKMNDFQYGYLIFYVTEVKYHPTPKKINYTYAKKQDFQWQFNFLKNSRSHLIFNFKFT